MRGWPTLLLILLLGETSSHRPGVRANRPGLKRDRPRAYGEGELRIRDRNSLAEQLAAARQRIAELEDVEVGLCGESRSPSESQDLRPASARRHCWAPPRWRSRRRGPPEAVRLQFDPDVVQALVGYLFGRRQAAWRLFRGAETALKRLRRPRARARRRAAPSRFLKGAA